MISRLSLPRRRTLCKMGWAATCGEVNRRVWREQGRSRTHHHSTKVKSSTSCLCFQRLHDSSPRPLQRSLLLFGGRLRAPRRLVRPVLGFVRRQGLSTGPAADAGRPRCIHAQAPPSRSSTAARNMNACRASLQLLSEKKPHHGAPGKPPPSVGAKKRDFRASLAVWSFRRVLSSFGWSLACSHLRSPFVSRE